MPDPTFDPERHALWLAPTGAVLVVAGIAIPRTWGLIPLGIGFALLLLSCYSVHDGLLLFGPTVRREMLRAVRQTRILLWRTIVVTVVGLAVGIVYGLVWYHVIPKASARPAALGAFVFVGWNLCVTFLPLLIQA